MSNYVNISSDIVEAQQRELQEEKKVSKPRIEFNEKNYLQLRVGPGETQRTVTVRILPISATDGRAFFTMNTHSMKVNQEISKSGFKSFICLNDSNVVDDIETEGCPLCDKAKELYAQADCCSDEFEKKDLVKAASQYRAKRTFIVRVIERGKEDEGVKFWKFNVRFDKTDPYNQILNLYKMRKESAEKKCKTENILDIYNGRDLNVTITAEGTSAPTIIDDSDRSPLSENEELMKEWIFDKKTWQDVFTCKPYDYLNLVAQMKVPWFDRNTNSWVDKAEFDLAHGKKVQESNSEINDAENKINQMIENTSEATNQSQSAQTLMQEIMLDEPGEDLPF